MVALEVARTEASRVGRHLAALPEGAQGGVPVDAELGGFEAQLDRGPLVIEGVARVIEGALQPP